MYKKALIFFFIIFGLSICKDKEITFLSTQLNPVEEANAMKNIILKDFPIKVNYKPYNDKEIYSYLTKEKPDLIGGSYGDFVSLKNKNLISPIDNLKKSLGTTHFITSLETMSKLNDNKTYFIPWMQATYIMVANKKALKYLPKNTDINNLTYDQFIEWGANIYKNTGTQKIGFPAGKSGLFHRFLQGYFYPSYTGTMAKKFSSSDARVMWEKLRDLWYYVSPQSLTYSKMDTPLLSEKIWVAWDHSARIIDAFKEKPNDFICFPAPIGPKGRGYLLILAGIGIPSDSSIKNETIDLIKYLIKDSTQILTMTSVGFFPVTELNTKVDPKFESLYTTMVSQAKSSKSIVSFTPLNLGEKSADFNNIYLHAFSQIILREKNITFTLDEQAKKLRALFNESGAYILLPDKMTSGSIIIE